MASNFNLPNEFYCPITFELMKDPVIGPDGQTYERYAIEEWLKTNNTSPLTKKAMHSTSLIPNYALRNAIEAFTKLGSFPTKREIAPPTSTSLDFSKDKINLSYNSKLLSNGNVLVNLSLNPPAYPTCANRKPTVFVAVIDVSGSMQSPVSVDNGDSKESHGFSRLDLVKHSFKTIINCMNDNDHFAIITFSDKAKLLLDLTKMTSVGKTSSSVVVDNMCVEGMTNIWDGLKLSLDLVKSINTKNTNVVISLLTDGVPNVNPPRGIMETLKKTITDNSLDVSISTFGFGYELDSKLLADIATVGNGIYGYIPDCTFVGTIFVNYMSNILSSMSIINKLDIKPEDGVTIVNENIYNKNIGPIQYGQKRDIILELKLSKNVSKLLDTVLTYDNDQVAELSITEKSNGSEHELMVQYNRYNFICSILKAIQLFNLNQRLSESIDCIQEFYKELAVSSVSNDGRMVALMKDIKSIDENEGQIGKSFSRQDWYDKWGKHYVPSVCKAHLFQQCLNFKDPSMQVFGGKLFSEIQETANDIFCSLPSPKPSCKTQSYLASTMNTVPTNMSYYYNSNSGCFDGNGIVQLADGCTKLVKELTKNDLVMSSDGKVSKIKCVVRTPVNKNIHLVSINNILITPWHPVKHNDNWIFPLDISKPQATYIDYVYNFVFENHYSMLVNGVECIGLGHEQQGPVLYHPYYGTQCVIQDLMQLDGWDNGFIELDGYTLERDNHGYVSKLLKNF